jgi:hypothetical protein
MLINEGVPAYIFLAASASEVQTRLSVALYKEFARLYVNVAAAKYVSFKISIKQYGKVVVGFVFVKPEKSV